MQLNTLRNCLMAVGLCFSFLAEAAVGSLDDGVPTSDITVTNALVFAAADVMSGKVAALSGKLTLGVGATLTVTDVPADIAEKTYTILTAAGGIEGPLPTLVGFEKTADPDHWVVVKTGNSLQLCFHRGVALMLKWR